MLSLNNCILIIIVLKYLLNLVILITIVSQQLN